MEFVKLHINVVLDNVVLVPFLFLFPLEAVVKRTFQCIMHGYFTSSCNCEVTEFLYSYCMWQILHHYDKNAKCDWSSSWSKVNSFLFDWDLLHFSM